MSSTSIGRGPAHGSNENHASDPTHTTLGEDDSQEAAPSGSEWATGAPDLPAGVAGGPARPGTRQGPQEPEAAKGKLPKDQA